MRDSLLWQAAGLEIFVFVAACAVMLADLFLAPRWRARLHWGVVGALGVAAVIAFGGVGGDAVAALNGFYIADGIAYALKGVILAAAAGSLAFSRHALRAYRIFNGEFLALALFSVLGMLVMASAGHFLTLYLGLELMSLCLYALIAMRRDSAAASEAAIKYFVLGALASGLFLYGVSMVYGVTGELFLGEVAARAEESTGAARAVLALGLVFVLSGIAFKLGLAPFHTWLPDVYHGAPAPVTLFIAAAPKVAALAMLVRALTEGLAALSADWRQMLMVLAVLSLCIGNVAAIAQTNVKRMLAYSAIAHGGFVALGVLAGGIGSALFYVAAYALMTVGGFGAVTILALGGRERAELGDMRGMAARNWLTALALAALMLSMAGVPPFVGFIAKFAVLQEVVRAGFVWLAVVAVVLSLVGAFYYLRVIRLMFFDAPAPDQKAIVLRPAAAVLLAVVGVLTVGLGIFPGGMLRFFAAAAG